MTGTILNRVTSWLFQIVLGALIVQLVFAYSSSSRYLHTWFVISEHEPILLWLFVLCTLCVTWKQAQWQSLNILKWRRGKASHKEKCLISWWL